MPDTLNTDRWYWDRRTHKALYPQEADEGTVRFVTVWHAEEVDDALDAGALVPLDDVGLDRTETTLDLLDSFRTPDAVTDGSGSSEPETDASRERSE